MLREGERGWRRWAKRSPAERERGDMRHERMSVAISPLLYPLVLSPSPSFLPPPLSLLILPLTSPQVETELAQIDFRKEQTQQQHIGGIARRRDRSLSSSSQEKRESEAYLELYGMEKK